ncbi:MAG TPA: cupin domain-containing protein [bacterium]|nr:cupin domain-containing protein [bacterium]
MEPKNPLKWPLESKLSEMDWGSMEWLLDDSIAPGADMSVAVMTVKGGELSPAHSHPNCNEFLLLTRGSVEQVSGGEKKVLQAGDSVFVPAGTVHSVRNLGATDAQMLVTYSAGVRKYESA